MQLGAVRGGRSQPETITVRTAILTAVLLTAIPAFAQQKTTAVEAECAENFKATDLNNDGVITHTEIAKAQQLPPTLAKESLASRNAFDVGLCTNGVVGADSAGRQTSATFAAQHWDDGFS